MQALWEWICRARIDVSVLIILIALIQLTFDQQLAARWRCSMWGLEMMRRMMPAMPASFSACSTGDPMVRRALCPHPAPLVMLPP